MSRLCRSCNWPSQGGVWPAGTAAASVSCQGRQPRVLKDTSAASMVTTCGCLVRALARVILGADSPPITRTAVGGTCRGVHARHDLGAHRVEAVAVDYRRSGRRWRRIGGAGFRSRGRRIGRRYACCTQPESTDQSAHDWGSAVAGHSAPGYLRSQAVRRSSGKIRWRRAMTSSSKSCSAWATESASGTLSEPSRPVSRSRTASLATSAHGLPRSAQA